MQAWVFDLGGELTGATSYHGGVLAIARRFSIRFWSDLCGGIVAGLRVLRDGSICA